MRGEKFQKARLAHRIDEVVANLSRIIAINRNLGFFTGGYNWVIQIVPYLIIAPAFIRGDIEFGVVTQSGAAFAMLVGAFSLIVRQFESISNFAAVVSRLTSLQDAIEKSHRTEAAIEIVEQDGPLTFEKLSLAAPEGGAMLLNDLSVSIPAGIRVLVTGHTHAPSSALFRQRPASRPRERGASSGRPISFFYRRGLICQWARCVKLWSGQTGKAKFPMLRSLRSYMNSGSTKRQLHPGARYAGGVAERSLARRSTDGGRSRRRT